MASGTDTRAPKSRWAMLALAALTLLFLAAGWWVARGGGRDVEAGARIGGDFTLTSADGPVSLHDLRGRVVLLYFGYTYCPDICPTSLSNLSLGLRQLDASEVARVRVVFVSVDPERDTPERLKTYAAAFHPAIVGVTGTQAELADVAARYGASFARQRVDSTAGYVMDHSASTYVIDREGRTVALLKHGTAPEEIARTIRRALSR